MAVRSTNEDNPDREKWRADLRLRKKELELKEQHQKYEFDLRREELTLKQDEAARSRWINPLVIAVLAAAAGAFGNAGVAWFNGSEQRKLEDQRARTNIEIENVRSEATRIWKQSKLATRTSPPQI